MIGKQACFGIAYELRNEKLLPVLGCLNLSHSAKERGMKVVLLRHTPKMVATDLWKDSGAHVSRYRPNMLPQQSLGQKKIEKKERYTANAPRDSNSSNFQLLGL